MIAIAAVAIAAVTQAASVDWSVGNNAWVLNDGSKASSGYTVYLINGATALDTIAAAINATTGAFNAEQTWVFGSAATDNGKGRVTELTTTSANMTRGTEYNFSVLMIDASNTSDIRYMVSSTNPQNAYLSGTDEALGVSFSAANFGENALTYNATSAANGWAALPEPTSGLLLLLGVAGLALKRKRA